MKKGFVFAFALLALPTAPALADTAQRTSACYNVSDPDHRAYCLARAHRDTGRCYSIQRGDLRQQCLVEVAR